MLSNVLKYLFHEVFGPMITIRSEREIELMRESGRLAAQTLDMIEPYVKPGVSTLELNDICHDYIVNTFVCPMALRTMRLKCKSR